MRWLVPLLPLILAACDKEPSFDDRYARAANEIQARANAMDDDIAKSDAAAKAAGADVPLPDTAKRSTAPPSSGE